MQVTATRVCVVGHAFLVACVKGKGAGEHKGAHGKGLPGNAPVAAWAWCCAGGCLAQPNRTACHQHGQAPQRACVREACVREACVKGASTATPVSKVQAPQRLCERPKHRDACVKGASTATPVSKVQAQQAPQTPRTPQSLCEREFATAAAAAVAAAAAYHPDTQTHTLAPLVGR